MPAATSLSIVGGGGQVATAKNASVALPSIAVSGNTVGTVWVTLAAKHGTLQVGETGAVGVSGNGTSIVQVRGNLSAVNAKLANVVYSPDGRFVGDTRVVVSASSFGPGSASQVVFGQVAAVRVTPAAQAMTVSAPSTVQVGDHDPVRLTGLNAVTLQNPNVGERRVTLTAVATGGTLTLAGRAAEVASGSGTTTLTLSGDTAAVSDALRTLRFTPADDFSGTASVVVTASDAAADGTDRSPAVEAKIAIVVTPSNAAPRLHLPESIQSRDGSAVSFTGASAVTISGAEETEFLRVKVDAQHGTLALTRPAPTGVGVQDNAASLSLTGTLADLNTALAAVTFTPDRDFAGVAGIAVSLAAVADQGSPQIARIPVPITALHAAASPAPPSGGSSAPSPAAESSPATVTPSAPATVLLAARPAATDVPPSSTGQEVPSKDATTNPGTTSNSAPVARRGEHGEAAPYRYVWPVGPSFTPTEEDRPDAPEEPSTSGTPFDVTLNPAYVQAVAEAKDTQEQSDEQAHDDHDQAVQDHAQQYSDDESDARGDRTSDQNDAQHDYDIALAEPNPHDVQAAQLVAAAQQAAALSDYNAAWELALGAYSQACDDAYEETVQSLPPDASQAEALVAWNAYYVACADACYDFALSMNAANAAYATAVDAAYQQLGDTEQLAANWQATHDSAAEFDYVVARAQAQRDYAEAVADAAQTRDLADAEASRQEQLDLVGSQYIYDGAVADAAILETQNWASGLGGPWAATQVQVAETQRTYDVAAATGNRTLGQANAAAAFARDSAQAAATLDKAFAIAAAAFDAVQHKAAIVRDTVGPAVDRADALHHATTDALADCNAAFIEAWKDLADASAGAVHVCVVADLESSLTCSLGCLAADLAYQNGNGTISLAERNDRYDQLFDECNDDYADHERACWLNEIDAAETHYDTCADAADAYVTATTQALADWQQGEDDARNVRETEIDLATVDQKHAIAAAEATYQKALADASATMTKAENAAQFTYDGTESDALKTETIAAETLKQQFLTATATSYAAVVAQWAAALGSTWGAYESTLAVSARQAATDDSTAEIKHATDDATADAKYAGAAALADRVYWDAGADADKAVAKTQADADLTQEAAVGYAPFDAVAGGASPNHTYTITAGFADRFVHAFGSRAGASEDTPSVAESVDRTLAYYEAWRVYNDTVAHARYDQAREYVEVWHAYVTGGSSGAYNDAVDALNDTYDAVVSDAWDQLQATLAQLQLQQGPNGPNAPSAAWTDRETLRYNAAASAIDAQAQWRIDHAAADRTNGDAWTTSGVTEDSARTSADTIWTAAEQAADVALANTTATAERAAQTRVAAAATAHDVNHWTNYRDDLRASPDSPLRDYELAADQELINAANAEGVALGTLTNGLNAASAIYTSAVGQAATTHSNTVAGADATYRSGATAADAAQDVDDGTAQFQHEQADATVAKIYRKAVAHAMTDYAAQLRYASQVHARAVWHNQCTLSGSALAAANHAADVSYAHRAGNAYVGYVTALAAADDTYAVALATNEWQNVADTVAADRRRAIAEKTLADAYAQAIVTADYNEAAATAAADLTKAQQAQVATAAYIQADADADVAAAEALATATADYDEAVADDESDNAWMNAVENAFVADARAVARADADETLAGAAAQRANQHATDLATAQTAVDTAGYDRTFQLGLATAGDASDLAQTNLTDDFTMALAGARRDAIVASAHAQKTHAVDLAAAQRDYAVGFADADPNDPNYDDVIHQLQVDQRTATVAADVARDKALANAAFQWTTATTAAAYSYQSATANRLLANAVTARDAAIQFASSSDNAVLTANTNELQARLQYWNTLASTVSADDRGNVRSGNHFAQVEAQVTVEALQAALANGDLSDEYEVSRIEAISTWLLDREDAALSVEDGVANLRATAAASVNAAYSTMQSAVNAAGRAEADAAAAAQAVADYQNVQARVSYELGQAQAERNYRSAVATAEHDHDIALADALAADTEYPETGSYSADHLAADGEAEADRVAARQDAKDTYTGAELTVYAQQYAALGTAATTAATTTANARLTAVAIQTAAIQSFAAATANARRTFVRSAADLRRDDIGRAANDLIRLYEALDQSNPQWAADHDATADAMRAADAAAGATRGQLQAAADQARAQTIAEAGQAVTDATSQTQAATNWDIADAQGTAQTLSAYAAARNALVTSGGSDAPLAGVALFGDSVPVLVSEQPGYAGTAVAAGYSSVPPTDYLGWWFNGAYSWLPFGGYGQGFGYFGGFGYGAGGYYGYYANSAYNGYFNQANYGPFFGYYGWGVGWGGLGAWGGYLGYPAGWGGFYGGTGSYSSGDIQATAESTASFTPACLAGLTATMAKSLDDLTERWERYVPTADNPVDTSSLDDTITPPTQPPRPEDRTDLILADAIETPLLAAVAETTDDAETASVDAPAAYASAELSVNEFDDESLPFDSVGSTHGGVLAGPSDALSDLQDGDAAPQNPQAQTPGFAFTPTTPLTVGVAGRLRGATVVAQTAAGRVTRLRDARGNETAFQYDPAGRVTRRTDALQHATTYQYNAAGRVARIEDRSGRVRTFTYDSSGRETGEVWKTAAGAVENTLTFTYEGGRLTRAAANDATYTYAYDARGRVTTTTTTLGLTLTSAYDAQGRRTVLSDSKGGAVAAGYDARGRQTSLTLTAPNTVGLKAALTVGRDGRVTRVDRSVKVGAAAYAAAGAVAVAAAGDTVTQTVTAPGGGVLAADAVTVDGAGRPVGATVNGVAQAFTYDDDGQLTGDGAGAYHYDAAGNRTDNNAAVGPDNRLTTDGVWAFAYDAEGNTVGKADGTTTWTYGYDARNALVEAWSRVGGGGGGERVAYAYDAFGNRVRERHYARATGTAAWTLTSEERHVYDNGQVYADLTGAGAVATRYLVGDGGARYARGVVGDLGTGAWAGVRSAWLTADRLGSVTQVVSAAGTQVLDAVTYSGFGGILTETNPGQRGEYGFTGLPADAGTGLVHAHWRDYAPQQGRWQQQDPLGFAAGDANLYRYVGNGPTAATDPSGLFLVAAQGAEGAYVGWLAEHGVQAATVELPKRGLFSSPRVGVAVSAAEGERVRAWYDATPASNTWDRSVLKALVDSNTNIVGDAKWRITLAELSEGERDALMALRTKLYDGAKYRRNEPRPGYGAELRAAAAEGLADGTVIVANRLTFQMIGPLNAESQRLIRENGGLYVGADLAGKVAAESLKAAAFAGAGGAFANVAGRGASWAGGVLKAAEETKYAGIACNVLKYGRAAGVVAQVGGGGLLAASTANNAGNLGAAIVEGDAEKIIESSVKLGVDVASLPAAWRGIAKTTQAIREKGIRGFLGGCFGAGTPVLSEHGSREIERLAAGDLVWSRAEGAADGPLVLRAVEEVFARMGRVWRLDVAGHTILTTGEHPVYVRRVGGFVPVSNVLAGDELAGHDGEFVTVEAAADTGEVATVYNFRVAETHTYFVGATEWGFALWVHNTENRLDSCIPGVRAPDTGLKAEANTTLQQQSLPGMGSSVHPNLPTRTGGKTLAVFKSNGTEVPLQSGQKGPGEWLTTNMSNLNFKQTVSATHVEGHAAGIMNKYGIKDADIYINYIGGPCDRFCKPYVSSLLPKGATLTVHYEMPDGSVRLGKFVSGVKDFIPIPD